MDPGEIRILIVDDEEDLCEILQYNLSNEGYISETANSAEEALLKGPSGYNLILLDVMMDSMSGFRLAHILRQEMKITAPVIFLTARDSENDILTGFRLGADDYISKPFSINELISRVKAVLRRTYTEKSSENAELIFQDLKLDTVLKKLIIQEDHIDLTKKEFEIFKLLLENQGKILSREYLLHQVWGSDVVVTDRTVDVNITRLRTKLGKYGQSLKNKIGFGYYFE